MKNLISDLKNLKKSKSLCILYEFCSKTKQKIEINIYPSFKNNVLELIEYFYK